jgi:hypothetical protein
MEVALCKFKLKRKSKVRKLERLCCVCSESLMDNLSCVSFQVIFNSFWEKLAESQAPATRVTLTQKSLSEIGRDS